MSATAPRLPRPACPPGFKRCVGARRHLVRLADAPRVILPEGSTHYGRANCPECGSLVTWLPRPETLAARATREDLLRRLLDAARLTEGEADFVASIAGSKNLTPAQQSWLDRIAAREAGALASQRGGQR